MGTEPVILTRTRQGEIAVLLNTCTHRGMKLCRYDQGNSRTFTCPYHGWSCSTDTTLVRRPGDLLGVPGQDTHYRGELDKSQWGLEVGGEGLRLQGHHLGDLGQGCAAVPRLPR